MELKKRPTIEELEAILSNPRAPQIVIAPDGSIHTAEPSPKRDWPDPTPETLGTPEFEAIWQCIKRWDINVPDAYSGYMGATGNHVRAILDALAAVPVK